MHLRLIYEDYIKHYQAKVKDSTEITLAEPCQLPYKPEAPKRTKSKIKLDEDKAKTRTKAGTTHMKFLPLAQLNI